MRGCAEYCKKTDTDCPCKECRLHIDYPEDLNCTEIAVQKEGDMTLMKIGNRLNLTPSRIKQIENKAVAKVSKTFKKLNIL